MIVRRIREHLGKRDFPALNRLIADDDGKLSLIQPLIDHARELRGQLTSADAN